MATLLIDRGNTSLKWQLIRDGLLVDSNVVTKHASFDEAFIGINKNDLSLVFVSSVGASEFELRLNKWCSSHEIKAPVYAKSISNACGVSNGYTDASKLGVDRWAAIIAAHHHYNGMKCVVDSGTALTLDIVDEDGRHHGGLIVPGYELMINSLLSGTDQINVQSAVNNEGLGADTTEAVTFGIKQMLQSFVMQKLVEIKCEYNEEPLLVITGGHGASLIDGLSIEASLDEELVFKGLMLLSSECV